MKTRMKPTLLAASLITLAPAFHAGADERNPDFGLEPRAASDTAPPAKSPSSLPDIKLEIDGRKIELNGTQIEAMVKEIMKSLAADNGKAARDMVSGLLGIEPGTEEEMLRNLIERIPDIQGGSSSNFKLGGETGIEFEGKAFMIGPDGEKREIEINSDEIQRKWKLHPGLLRDFEPVPAPDTDAEAVELRDLPAYYIGVAVDPAPAALRNHFGLGDSGVTVTSAFAGSPAAQAGLAKDDLIVKADGEPQNSVESLIAAVRKAGGNAMKLEIVRSGVREEITVTPAKREQPTVSDLFVPKIETSEEAHEEAEASGAPAAGTDELQELRDEVRETHALLEKILERMDKLEKDGE